MATKKVASKKTAAPVQAAAEKKPTAEKKAALKKTPAPKKTASSPTQVAPTHRDIEMLAYELWEQGGGLHGNDAQHWSRAEHQLKNQRSK
jgi:hypothetical protein